MTIPPDDLPIDARVLLEKHPVSPERRAEIEQGKQRVEREVRRMMAADRREGIEPARGERGMQRLGDSAERLQRKLAEREQERREQMAAEREAFRGECFICRDTGPCRHCERGRPILERQQDIERERTIMERLTRSGVPYAMAAWSFDSFPANGPDAKSFRNWLDEWDRKQWLVLAGDYGTGKTGLVISGLRYLFSETRFDSKAYWTTYSDMMASLRPGGEPPVDYRTVRLLVIDDIGFGKQSEWTEETLFSIVNTRYNWRLPTWMTTNNATPEAIAAAVGERIFWRIQHGSHMVVLRGENLRV